MLIKVSYLTLLNNLKKTNTRFNMTPKEKAEELYYKFTCVAPLHSDNKECALIAVDEILNSSPSLPILGDGGTYGEDIELSKLYWQEVKQEIEKL